ncbi:L-rhamnose isomerase [Diplocloster agilis]|uniref:L-rhamnose isomerase n=1 Tax=Diplocloster agilis TaxID=2850323 RepID=A0A949K211_9FIRM|nr:MULTISPECIES: L-rhamnose isomerase [Lachnospiraceae]MBU9738249.1 L-rhamnose isomerase [Diplocloster agilis]MBU9744428.1 L-rhamnose isomerase [Diplocloster agilis]MCU6735783.1 L-rhamnose isomerase [Suonthocola fibrivorans]SCJ81673.1 L-rhamnose isomerase [uncultured Clostridium sp.]
MYDVKQGYEAAKAYYAQFGVDVDEAIKVANETPISMHCWQGDDVAGLEKKEDTSLTGGIQTTGNYPGKARNGEELRADLEVAMKYIPGEIKVNLHASYLEADTFVDRNEVAPEHFKKWADWAVEKGVGLDFNPTYFSHPLSEKATLSSADEEIRKFWIQHGINCRRIGQYFYERTGKTCVINHWTPDGDKEFPIDTVGPRLRMKDSYDQIFEATKDVVGVMDGIESKVFGIGAESYTVGSHEFSMAYALNARKDNIIMTLDTGHFHPTEVVSAKLGALYAFVDHILLHVSRPVRWDSDHVVSFDDETRAIMEELVRLNRLQDTYIATDFFDASINRICAWTIGLRNTRKAMLAALLQPVDKMKELEATGDVSARLAFKEEFKAAPFSLVWDYYCAQQNAGVSLDWLEEVKAYEAEILKVRS